jgi:molybdate transport system ATP-binding protein
MALEVRIRAHMGSFRLDVGFEADEGVTAVLGASGAGKTLTLRAIAGLFRPDSGRIAIGARALYDSLAQLDLPARERKVGYMFQEYALFPHLSVADNITFGLRGVPHAQVRALLTETLELLGLSGLDKRFPDGLSGGQRQRVALGRALASRPKVLLLDEPFSSLDSPTRSAVTEQFLSLRSQIAVPTVLVTHDTTEAYSLAQRLVVLHEGAVLQEGPREDVFHHPASPQVARLIGVRNVLRGVVSDVSDQGAEVAIGHLRTYLPGVRAVVGSALTIGIRPEHVVAKPASVASPANGTLVQDVDMGLARRVAITLGSGPDGKDLSIYADLAPGTAKVLTHPLPDLWNVMLPAHAVHVWPQG